MTNARYFDLQPTLLSPLLTVRPLKREDFDELYAVASDPEMWAQHFEPTRYEKQVFTKLFEDSLLSLGALVVIENSSRRVIGSSRYYHLNLESDEVVIGYTFLAKQFWGRQHNRELKRLMLDHAFQYVSNVVFYVYEKNIRSQRAVEKIGAKKIELTHGTHHNSFKYLLKREAEL